MTRLRWSRGSWMLRTRARHRRRALSNFNRSKRQYLVPLQVSYLSFLLGCWPHGWVHYTRSRPGRGHERPCGAFAPLRARANSFAVPGLLAAARVNFLLAAASRSADGAVAAETWSSSPSRASSRLRRSSGGEACLTPRTIGLTSALWPGGVRGGVPGETRRPTDREVSPLHVPPARARDCEASGVPCLGPTDACQCGCCCCCCALARGQREERERPSCSALVALLPSSSRYTDTLT